MYNFSKDFIKYSFRDLKIRITANLEKTASTFCFFYSF